MKRTWLTAALASFVLAALLGGFGGFMRDWVLKLDSQPQVITAADLVAKGPGDNYHVRITDCDFGPAVLEKGPNDSHAWFPVYPRRGEFRDKASPPIVYRSASDPREVAVLSRPPRVLEGVVCNGITGLEMKATGDFLKAYPGLDQSRVWYVRQLDGPFREVVLGAWAGAVLFTLVGLVALEKWRTAPAAPPVEAVPQTTAAASEEAPAPRATAAVPRYRGTRDALPPEVVALGQAEHIHQPGPLLRLARDNPAMVTIPGSLIVVAGLGIMMAYGLPGDRFLSIGLFVVMMAGLIVALLPWLQGGIASYLVFKDALVVVEGDDFIVIRWEELKELNFPRLLVTSDGQKFMLANMVEDLGRLYDTVQFRLRERLLPPVVAALQAGQSVTFGPFTVSKDAISYEGKTLPWSRVRSMQITANAQMGTRTLSIWEGSFLAWCNGNLNAVPNDWLFLDAVKMVCPPHLLVPAGGRR